MNEKNDPAAAVLRAADEVYCSDHYRIPDNLFEAVEAWRAAGRPGLEKKPEGKIYTFCPECGYNVQIDEDGLCVTCGATAIGRAVDNMNPPVPELTAVVRRLVDGYLKQTLDTKCRAILCDLAERLDASTDARLTVLDAEIDVDLYEGYRVAVLPRDTDVPVGTPVKVVFDVKEREA